MKEFQPESQSIITHDRKTTELCGHERDGVRCMRKHGHKDQHECLFARGQPLVRWD